MALILRFPPPRYPPRMHLLLEPLLRLFASLVSRGGQPHPDRNQYGPVLVYPLRPGISLFFLGCLAVTAVSVAVDLRPVLHLGLAAPHPWRFLLALCLGALALVMLTRTLSLDEQGLHLRSLLGHHHVDIPWSDLHHVERYQSRFAGRAIWFLRSADTRTTLTVPEMTYNTAHLLAEIRRRQSLPELPHVRRHWYGN